MGSWSGVSSGQFSAQRESAVRSVVAGAGEGRGGGRLFPEKIAAVLPLECLGNAMTTQPRTFWMLALLLLLAVGGVFLLLSRLGSDWWRWSPAAGSAGPGGPRLPDMAQGGSEEETGEPGTPAAPATARTLLELLEERVQAVGAIRNEALVTFRDRAAYEAFLKRAEAAGLRVRGRMDDWLSARVAFDRLARLRDDVLAHPEDYEDIGANHLVRVPGLPPAEDRPAGGDAPFGEAALAAIGAQGDRSLWGQGVTVAVLDTGVFDHPTFRPGQVTHIDLVQDGQPLEGHGTAMASLIAGSAPGALGVAPAARILDIRVADAHGDSDSFALATGIREAVRQGADVINISLVSYGDSKLLHRAVQEASGRGIAIFAAQGNEAAAVAGLPAGYPEVIGVSGLDAAGRLAYFSNSGDPFIGAPAVQIPSAYVNEGKTYFVMGDGTSQASALAAGVGAVYRGWGMDVTQALPARARQTEATPREAGAGLIQIGPVR